MSAAQWSEYERVGVISADTSFTQKLALAKHWAVTTSPAEPAVVELRLTPELVRSSERVFALDARPPDEGGDFLDVGEVRFDVDVPVGLATVARLSRRSVAQLLATQRRRYGDARR